MNSAQVIENGFIVDLAGWAITACQEQTELAQRGMFDRVNAGKDRQLAVRAEEQQERVGCDCRASRALRRYISVDLEKLQSDRLAPSTERFKISANVRLKG